MPIRKIILYLLVLVGSLVFQQPAFSSDNKPFTDQSQLPGEYYWGDGLGTNQYLNLSDKSTFTYQWTGCLGTYDENEGQYRLEDGVLVLTSQRPNIRKSFKAMPTRFLPVTWGQRLYLIPEKEVLEFVNEINQGREPRDEAHGSFYLRKDDEKKPVDGFPALPADWQDYLLKNPAQGTVTKVQGRKATVNIGKKQGLKEGMILTARNPKEPRFAQLKIVSVDEETAKAETLYRDDKIEKDDVVSTLFFPPAP